MEIKKAKRGVKRTIMVLDSETIGFGIEKGSKIMAIKYNEETGLFDKKHYNQYLQGGFENLTKELKQKFVVGLYTDLGIEIEFINKYSQFDLKDMDRLSELEEYVGKDGWKVSKKDTLSLWKKADDKDFAKKQKEHKENVKKQIVADGYTTQYHKLCYDIGYTVARFNNKTKKMETLRERSYLVKEVFMDMTIMEKAYFFSKHPTYLEMLGSNEIEMKPMKEILEIMESDVSEFGINTFSNYNAGFDTNAIKDTIKILKCETPSNFEIMLEDVWCIWNMSCQLLYQTPSYVKMALENGWISQSGKYLLTNAEVGYRYLKNDVDFIEDHTALSDARIETEILGYILRKGKSVDKTINAKCWNQAKISKFCTVEKLAIQRLSKDEIKTILKKN